MAQATEIEAPRDGQRSLTEHENAAEPPFTIFSTNQKRWIVLLAAFAGMFSPMSSFIFYPGIDAIANGLHVTVGLVNIAITTYMVASAVVPAVLGSAADAIGRRPIYLLAMLLYLAANLGLSLQNSHGGLLALRVLQSVGSSATISLGYGVISDITTRAERGAYVGVLLLGPNVAPPVGPIIGGVLVAKLGWKWIFWFLCILGGACLVLVFMALPETSRVIVGNGSLPARGIYRSLLPSLVEPERTMVDTRVDMDADETSSKFVLPNPLLSLKLLRHVDIAAVVVCNGMYYMVYCCIQASLSTSFIEMYGYGSLEAGLIYIPFGVACLVSTFTWGRLLDFDYARTARQCGFPVERQSADETPNFPLEKARLRSALYLVGACTLSIVGYGWTMQYRVHVAAPLILQTIVGFASTGLFVALGALLTDLNPRQSSTAAASANIVRCALAATALAVLQVIIDNIGIGWCFSILGALSSMCGPLMVWEMRNGCKHRGSRIE